MKKKLSLMLCLCIMALTLAACGSADPQDVDYGGMSYSDLQSSAQNLVTSIAASSEEELSAAIETNEQYAKQYAKQYGREYTEAEAVISLLQSWLDTTSDVGTFVGLGEFSIDKTSDTVTVDQIVNFSERDVDVTFVYEYNYLTEEIDVFPCRTIDNSTVTAMLGNIFQNILLFILRLVHLKKQIFPVKSIYQCKRILQS